ncbi:MAG: hypothetical protein M1541_19955, partial [Acidobacteria bacterium]|nr:hypothetical protein [Acidobacteriota bacterium]
ELEIRAHPACGENPAQIPLCELQFLELGHILLQGWLGITAAYCDRRLLYNTRSSPSVRRFLVALRSAFVPPDAKPASKPTNFGRPLDLKFRNAYADELTPGEELAAQFFQPAQLRLRRFGPLKREFWSPADLIAITNRRVMWITDRYRERHEPFGTITRFAPFRAISEYACIPSQGGVNLAVALQSGLDWRVPVSNELEGEARAFVQAAESR